MILGLLRRRRDVRIARRDRIRRSADFFIAAWDNDPHIAFWRAHDRMSDPSTPTKDRRTWRALLDEIDRRRPASTSRGDTATRLLFRSFRR
jgi:hypothetical protein